MQSIGWIATWVDFASCELDVSHGLQDVPTGSKILMTSVMVFSLQNRGG